MQQCLKARSQQQLHMMHRCQCTNGDASARSCISLQLMQNQAHHGSHSQR